MSGPIHYVMSRVMKHVSYLFLLDFSIRHVVTLNDLATLVLGLERNSRLRLLGSGIYLFLFGVSKKPGPAEPE